MSNINDIINKYALDLQKCVLFVLTAPYDKVSMLDVSTLTSQGNPLAQQNTLFLRQLQIIRDCFEIIVASKNIDTIKSRLILFHQTIYNISAYWQLLGNIDLSEIFKLIDELKQKSHTSFYLNIYLYNLEKSKNAKKKPTIEKYYKLAIASLKSGTVDAIVDQHLINSYIDIHKKDDLFASIETTSILEITIDGQKVDLSSQINT